MNKIREYLNENNIKYRILRNNNSIVIEDNGNVLGIRYDEGEYLIIIKYQDEEIPSGYKTDNVNKVINLIKQLLLDD